MPADAGGPPTDEPTPDSAEQNPRAKRRSSEAVRRQERSGRDIWYFIDVLGRPASALFAATAVGLFGFFGQMALEHSQNARMYVELMSQREQAESGIRKDMFTAVLNEFFTTGSGGPIDISEKLLQLEMLALNFGETLSLSPLFRELERDLADMESDPAKDPFMWQLKKERFTQRLRSLASRVTEWQLSRLSIGGDRFVIMVPVDKVLGNGAFHWPDDVARETWELNDSTLLAEYIVPTYFELDSAGQREVLDTVVLLEDTVVTRVREDWIEATKIEMATFTLGDVTRRFSVRFGEAKPTNATIHVVLSVDSSDESNEFGFDLSFFDFPMIDHARLSADHRFSVVMQNFESDVITIAGVSFPGLYASQREQPFLNEVIGQVHDQTEGNVRR